MDYSKMSVDELINESIKLKREIAELKDRRVAIKEAIKRNNDEAAIRAKLGKLSEGERNALREVYGLGDVVVTPGPARLNLKGG